MSYLGHVKHRVPGELHIAYLRFQNISALHV